MLEESIKDLIAAVEENSRLVKASNEALLAVASQASSSVVADIASAEKPAKKTKSKKPEKVEKAEPETAERTIRDVVELCSKRRVTRDQVVTLLNEYDAAKLPDLDAKHIPEFYDRLVSLNSGQNEAA